MELHLKIIGVLLIVLSLAHVAFPRYFDWGNELKPLSAINRQMMYVHMLFIALIVLLMGWLCLTGAPDLIQTTLGHKIAFGLGVFWLTRLLIQFFGYSTELWRGKRFETIVHILFSLFWVYLCVVFFSIYLQPLQ